MEQQDENEEKKIKKKKTKRTKDGLFGKAEEHKEYLSIF